jgi:hypothetical protein
MFSNIFECRAVYEIMCKNMIDPDRPQMTIWRMRITCWISMVMNTYQNTYCFSLQQWLHERTSILRYTTYIACLVSYYVVYTIKKRR